MTMPNVDWTALTAAELDQCITDIQAEQKRRSDVFHIPKQMAQLNVQYLDSSGVVPGEAWVQPTGAHDAYPKDWTVTYDGGQWVSLVDANVWEPGVANWRADSDEEFPVWVQPTGAHDSYKTGDKVSHLGLHWASDINDNVWEPGVYGWMEVP